MKRWLARRQHAVFITQLTALHDYADGRIRKGDMDFDNTVYRMREATRTLLDILPIKLP